MDAFIEILDVYKTESTAFKELCVFIVTAVLIFLNLGSDICSPYSNN